MSRDARLRRVVRRGSLLALEPETPAVADQHLAGVIGPGQSHRRARALLDASACHPGEMLGSQVVRADEKERGRHPPDSLGERVSPRASQLVESMLEVIIHEQTCV